MSMSSEVELAAAAKALPTAAERTPDGAVHLSALDGVRGLAILAVVGVHLNLSFAPGGGMGVVVFFTLSGYLITGLLLSERERFGRVSLRFFFARRALRLLPALVMVLVLTCGIAIAEYHLPVARDTLRFAPAALFYVGNWIAAAHSSYTGGTLAHTWSLSVEEQFYLVWPLLLICLLRRRAKPGVLVAVALAGAAASDLGKLVLWTSGGSVGADANRMYGTDLAGDALLIGCALAVAVRAWPQRTLRLVRPLAALGVLYLVVVVTAIHPYGGSFASTRAFMVVAWPATSLAAAAAIGYAALAPRDWLARLLGVRPLAYLGRISYGVYLWHYPIFIWFAVWFGFAPGHPPLWQVLIDAGTALVIAALSYHLVEVRALALKRRVRQRPGAARVSGATVGRVAAVRQPPGA